MTKQVPVIIVALADIQRLEKLRDVVRVALDPGVWTDEHTEAIKRLTGKDEIAYNDIWEMAKGADYEPL